MTEIYPGRIPMSDDEKSAIETLKNIVSLSRTEPNEQGPIQVETTTGVWLITGKKVERVG